MKTLRQVSKQRHEYESSENGFLTSRVKEIFKPSKIKQRGFYPKCTKKELKDYFYVYVKKHGRNCYYCKEPWTYIVNKYNLGGKSRKNKSDKGKSRIKKIKNLSIDRLDSSKTYSIDNIIFCCVKCNLQKKDISIKQIKRLYEVITEKNL